MREDEIRESHESNSISEQLMVVMLLKDMKEIKGRVGQGWKSENRRWKTLWRCQLDR